MSDGDPEDWPAHPVELRQLERSLRCQICQELYQGPVVLKCGHTFCSLCIRSCLSVFSKEGRPAACPTCRDPTDQADLRPVTHLRDACAAWKAVRQRLLQQHLQAVEQQGQQSNPTSGQRNHARAARLSMQPGMKKKQQQMPARLAQPLNANLQQQLQQQQQPNRASSTPPFGHASIQASGYSKGQQTTPEPAITISSNGGAGSGTSDTAASEEPGDEADSQRNDSDPDWHAEDNDQQQHQRQPPGTAGRQSSKRRSRDSSSSGKGGAAASCHPEPAAPAAAAFDADSDIIMADGDSDFEPAEQPSAKRVKAAQHAGQGKENKGGPLVQPESGKGQPAPAAANSPQQPPQQPGYVACPICSCSVKATFINSHIDACLTKTDTQQQQQPAGRTAVHAQKQPAPASKVEQRLSAALEDPAGPAVVHGTASSGGSRLASGRSGPAAAAAAAGGGSAAAVRRSRVKLLDAPPKLCFELMKEKDLKVKLTALGLSNEGNKKVCTERYTFFRNFVLSLKDSGSSMTLKEAAADFMRQQRKFARAASRPQSMAALAGAPTPSGTTAAAAAAAGLRGSIRASEGGEGGLGSDLGDVDNSYATLIQQTRERMASKKRDTEQQQQRQQGPEQQQNEQPQEAAVDTDTPVRSLGPSTEPQQQDTVSDGQQGGGQQQSGQGDRSAQMPAAQPGEADLQQCDIGRELMHTDTAAPAALAAHKQQQLAMAVSDAFHEPYVGTEPDGYLDAVVPESDDDF